MHSDYVVDLCSVNDCDLLRRGEISKDLLSQALFSLMLHVLCNLFFLFRSTRVHTGARHNRSMMHSTISTISCARRRVELIYIVLYSNTCLPFYLSRSTCALCVCVFVCVCACVREREREWVSEFCYTCEDQTEIFDFVRTFGRSSQGNVIIEILNEVYLKI